MEHQAVHWYTWRSRSPAGRLLSSSLGNVNIASIATCTMGSGDSSVSVVTCWTIWGSNSGTSKRLFSSAERTNQLCEPSRLVFDGYKVYFPGIKRAGRETDHSPTSSSEVKNEWSYTSALPICLHGVDRHNCTRTCTLFSRPILSIVSSSVLLTLLAFL
jgi:hypothetical protein